MGKQRPILRAEENRAGDILEGFHVLIDRPRWILPIPVSPSRAPRGEQAPQCLPVLQDGVVVVVDLLQHICVPDVLVLGPLHDWFQDELLAFGETKRGREGVENETKRCNVKKVQKGSVV